MSEMYLLDLERIASLAVLATMFGKPEQIAGSFVGKAHRLFSDTGSHQWMLLYFLSKLFTTL